MLIANVKRKKVCRMSIRHKDNINKKCTVCQKKFPIRSMQPLVFVRESIWKLLEQDMPDAKRNTGYLCADDYQTYKLKRLNQIILQERGEVTELDQDVIDSMKTDELLAENINESYEEQLTLGERVADKVSTFGGSWKFIGVFFSFLFIWMFINSYYLAQHEQFDTYPYILLNLILSCLAAAQAPIIMMSQNRRADRDRITAENDYKVNLKSELQIRHLNTKLDSFMHFQWSRLVEIQQVQTELISDINEVLKKIEDTASNGNGNNTQKPST